MFSVHFDLDCFKKVEDLLTLKAFCQWDYPLYHSIHGIFFKGFMFSLKGSVYGKIIKVF